MYTENKLKPAIKKLKPYFITTKLSKNLHNKVCNEVVTILYFALSEKLLELVRINLSQETSDNLNEEKKQIN
jgi:hypothetical protein